MQPTSMPAETLRNSSTEAHSSPKALVEVPSGLVPVVDDVYSDRLRCDHPRALDGSALGEALVEAAEERGRGRVVALVPARLADGLTEVGFEVEGVMPGFYEGRADCAVVGHALDSARAELANPVEVARVDALLDKTLPAKDHAPVETVLAGPEHAEAVAELLGETFTDYPTPSSDPAYIAKQIEAGTPIRLVEDGGRVVACASADLVTSARTAELTDCATRKSHRGRGLLGAILRDLVGDLGRMGYPTAFTLARARIPGINLAFQRLGLEYRGRMTQSCRIGEGLEDMNIWSGRLAID